MVYTNISSVSSIPVLTGLTLHEGQQICSFSYSVKLPIKTIQYLNRLSRHVNAAFQNE